VGTATNGEEALASAQQTDFDVAVVDYKMPGMDGLELAKRLKEMKPDAKVIVLTSYEVRDLVSESPYADQYHEKIAVDSLNDTILELTGSMAGKKRGLFRRG
jgi:CheY-like chemotaxis protein